MSERRRTRSGSSSDGDFSDEESLEIEPQRRRLAFDEETDEDVVSEEPGVTTFSMETFINPSMTLVEGQRYENQQYNGCVFSNVHYINCSFEDVLFTADDDNNMDTQFSNCIFENCTFTYCGFERVGFYDVNFANTTIEYSSINGCKILDTTFVIGSLRSVEFDTMTLMCRVNFSGTILKNVKLEVMNLSSVEFDPNDPSGTPSGSIMGDETSFNMSVLSASLMSAVGTTNGSVRLTSDFDSERTRRVCETLERERVNLHEYIEHDLDMRGIPREEENSEEEDEEVASAIAVAEQSARARPEELRERAAALAAQTAIEEQPEPVFTGPTCWDIIMQNSEQITDFLAEDPENFVIGVKKPNGEIEYECQRLSDYQRDLIEPRPTDRSPYKMFHECTDDAPERLQFDYNKWFLQDGRTFVKMHSSRFIVVKPDWLFDGPVPEPRAFILEREPRDVRKYMTSELVPTIISTFNSYGADHCNQKTSQGVYRLDPATLDSNGNVPLTYPLSATGGKRKTRKGKRKNKKVTKKKNNKNRHQRKQIKSRRLKRNNRGGRKSRK